MSGVPMESFAFVSPLIEPHPSTAHIDPRKNAGAFVRIFSLYFIHVHADPRRKRWAQELLNLRECLQSKQFGLMRVRA